MEDQAIKLSELGLDLDELQKRLVQALSESILTSEYRDEDGMLSVGASMFRRELEGKVKEAITAKVEEIAEREIVPRVAELIEQTTLQRTNDWGEARGGAITFTEYLVQRAEAHLAEAVDYEGKPVGRDAYGKQTQTRVTHLIDKHLHYAIRHAMEQAVGNANQVIAEGLAETAKIKLAEIAEKLSVEVSVNK